MEKPAPLGNLKEVLPLELRKKIYDKLVSASKDENFKLTNLSCEILLDDGRGFQLVLTDDKVIHIIFKIDIYSLETKEKIEEKIACFCLNRNNLEFLIEE